MVYGGAVSYEVAVRMPYRGLASLVQLSNRYNLEAAKAAKEYARKARRRR